MSYVVLARKWRPMRFEDLVGQDHVARTLGNAIDAGRVAHAFLFTGVRGVGKTTSARILAKALNCMREPGTVKPGDPDPGPTVTPCLKCPACQEITEGHDVDVWEIDGASYNGVDEVRKLQESLPYRPSRDRYKVVIVDEVHMLSKPAFNAFLKTLEEPPPHVKFIFATTEVHKVPITILSRIQRFDFKMIPTRLIADRLRYVLSEEKIGTDEASLTLVARQAAGSMRDAMSLLDQVIAFCGEKLEGDQVAAVLGVASRGALLSVARAVVEGDQMRCLSLVQALAEQGFDLAHVARDVLSLLRDLVVARVCSDPKELLDWADEERTEVIALAETASENDLLRLHHAFSKDFDSVVRSSDPRASLEMLLVRLALRPPLLPLDELLHRIGNLERRLLTAGGSGRPTGGPRGQSSGGGGSPAGARPGHEKEPASKPHDQSRRADSASAPPPREEESDVHDAGSSEAAPISTAAPSLGAAPIPVPPREEESDATATPIPAPPEDEQARLQTFTQIVDEIRSEDEELAAYFEQTVPLTADGKTLSLGLAPRHIFEKQLTSEKATKAMERALEKLWGPDAKYSLSLNSKDAPPERTLSAERVRQQKLRHEEAVQKVKNHPRVREAVLLFDARIKQVNVAEPQA